MFHIIHKSLPFFLFFSFISTLCAEESYLTPAQLANCTACHGTHGVSSNPMWPNLAGLDAAYSVKQIHDMKKHTRNMPLMVGIISTLSEEELQSIAEYYQHQRISIGITPKTSLERGEQLYRGGDRQKHISACIACHGPTGEGNGQAGFPLLSGQQALYTMQQLKAFKTKQRSNDLNGIMRSIASYMGDDDMKAVAEYIQGLYPRDRLSTCCQTR